MQTNNVAKGIADLDISEFEKLHMKAPLLDFEEATLTGWADLSGEQSEPHSQYGYMLGVPSDGAGDWTSLQGCLGNEDLDIDPHYAFFGCNTESQVTFEDLSIFLLPIMYKPMHECQK